MANKEFYVTDEVYFMNNNKPTKGVIVSKLNIIRESIDIPDTFYYNYYKNHYSSIVSDIKEYHEYAYHVALLPNENDADVHLKPLEYCINGDYLFSSKDDLLEFLRNMPD